MDLVFGRVLSEDVFLPPGCFDLILTMSFEVLKPFPLSPFYNASHLLGMVLTWASPPTDG